MADEQTRFPYSVIGDHGEVITSGTSNTMPPESAGLILDVEAPANTWWTGTGFAPLGERPTAYHRWDWPSHLWVDIRDVALWKTIKWAEVKAARDGAMIAGVETPFGRFDADDAAVLKMTATYATLDAQPETWTIGWTRFDNSVALLDKETFRTVALSVLSYGSAVHAIGQELRERIDAATLVGELVAIRWPD